MKKIIIILGMFNINCSCISSSDEPLTLIKKDNNSLALRIDGYYYFISPFTTNLKDIYIYYKNGILIYPSNIEDVNFEGVNAYFTSDWFLNTVLKKSKQLYGLYSIENGTFIFEKWLFDGGRNRVVKHVCNILNDTTFQIITTSSFNGIKDVTSQNRIYHFHQFSPKPDSTNSFIP
jgi:exopolysaccharide biosynthesis protein